VILSKAEVAAVLRAAEGTWLHLPVLVGVTTGMRRGEILGLRWSDVDLGKGKLTVNQSLERMQGKSVLKSPKTAAGSRRTITLPVLTVEALKAHRTAQAAERLALGLGKPELVFGQAGPKDPDSLTKGFERLVKDAGVRRITFHGLRHTHISHQLMDGVHVKVVSERAGHANASITLAVYAAFVPNMQADAAAGVDTWLRQALAEEVGGKSVAKPNFRPRPEPKNGR
jgi:integrase